MLLRADEDNDDVIESFSLYYTFSVFPSFVYYYIEVFDISFIIWRIDWLGNLYETVDEINETVYRW